MVYQKKKWRLQKKKKKIKTESYNCTQDKDKTGTIQDILTGN